MKKLNSTKFSAASFNVAMFLLRVFSGILMMMHGYGKLTGFGTMRYKFMNFLGLGSSISLALVVFAEFFCALFIILGVFTRLAAIPIIIVMGVALFVANDADFFGEGELPAIYLGCFLTILLLGPGKASIDGMIGK